MSFRVPLGFGSCDESSALMSQIPHENILVILLEVLPSSLSASMFSCSWFKPLLVTEENCQLRTWDSWDHFACGGLRKNFRFWGEREKKKKRQERELTAKKPQKHGSGAIISVGRPKHLRTGYSFPWLRIPGAFTTAIFGPCQGYWISIHHGILKDTLVWYKTSVGDS